jgi:hypothetical protein
MTTFAVTNSNDLLPAVNYLLSNLDTGTAGNVVLPGNVLVANTTTGVVSQSGNTTPVAYLYQYVNLRYSNNATGTDGFDTNSNNYSFFGVYNSTGPTPSANPTAYQFFQVSPPFDTATSRTLYYSAIGGRQIQWAAASSPPSTSYQVTTANVAIDLDVVTTATGTPGDRGPIALCFVITTADPAKPPATDAQLTGWFEASRDSLTPPIGTGLTPVVGDTATFTWAAGPGSPTETYSYNGSVWVPADGQVVSGQTIVAGSLPGTAITANTVTSTQIATNTITANNIATGTITATQIAANTITANNIATGTITANNIATGTITATQIAANTVTANNIATNTITANNIAANTITSNNIATNTITANNIASGTITANNIATGTLTTNLFTANSINASIITANTFSANTISGQAITSQSISADKLEANVLIANTVVSTGATIGNFTSQGFWLQGNTGNARFGNTVSIGNNLSVGANAVIGGNLSVSGLVTAGNLNINTVSTNTMVAGAVTSFTSYQISGRYGITPGASNVFVTWQDASSILTLTTIQANQTVFLWFNAGYEFFYNGTGGAGSQNVTFTGRIARREFPSGANVVSIQEYNRTQSIPFSAPVGSSARIYPPNNTIVDTVPTARQYQYVFQVRYNDAASPNINVSSITIGETGFAATGDVTPLNLLGLALKR